MKGIFCLAALAAVASGAALATPTCTNVTLEKTSSGALITYDLDADAVVTLDLEDGGVALAPENLVSLSGDGWGFVKAGTGRRILWKGHRDVRNHLFAEMKAVLTAWDPDVPPPYMVVDLRPGKGNVAYYASKEKVPYGVTNKMYKTTHLVLAKIPAAGRTWCLGSNPGQQSTPRREIRRNVALTEDYYMGIYEFTGGQWLQFMDTNPSQLHPCTTDRDVAPVEYVSWADVHGADINAAPAEGTLLGLLRNRTGMDFNLPRAAQWEVAARAGCGGVCNVPGATQSQVAWMSSNLADDPKCADGTYSPTATTTHEVGLKLPNAFGLYDTIGNVLEMGCGYLFDNEVAFVANFGEGARLDNYRDIVWIDPHTPSRTIVVDGTTYKSTGNTYGRWGGACRESGAGVGPSRWAGSGGSKQVDTGFRVSCSVRNAGRLN